MTDWIGELQALAAREKSSVLLTVAGVRGSAPRETGARMIVTATESIGTIGGGQLEYQCVRLACEQLRATQLAPATISTRRFVLGAGCGQCCGGVVDVMFELLRGSTAGWLSELAQFHEQRRPVVIVTSLSGQPCRYLVTADMSKSFGEAPDCPAPTVAAAQDMLVSADPASIVHDHLLEPVRQSDFHIAVFGAGHVGAAVIDALSRLDCSIRWIDGRRNMLPRNVPANVLAIESGEPAREVAAMPPGSCFLVMTHSHPLDLEICARILRRDDFAYCGLIGSASKRRRFAGLLKKQGVEENLLHKLVCPIGIAGIVGKQPVEIAVSVAAQLLQVKAACAAGGRKPVQLKVLG